MKIQISGTYVANHEGKEGNPSYDGNRQQGRMLRLVDLCVFLVYAVHFQLICALDLLLLLLPAYVYTCVLLARKQMGQNRWLFEFDFEDLSFAGLWGFVVSYILFSYFSPCELKGIVLDKPIEYGHL